MPQTKVNTPSGTITVNHPEGATEEQILRFAKRQYEQGEATREQRIASLAESNPAEFDPTSPEFRERYGAALPGVTGAVQNAFAGAGKFLFDRARGVGQLLGEVEQEDIDAARARDADLMRTKSGLAGNVLGGAAFTAPLLAVPGANTTAGAALIGAGIGASEPVATGESRGLNVALGAGGGAAGQRLGRFIGGRVGSQVDDAADDFASGLNRAESEALQRAEGLGFRATPGQASGSQQLRQLEAALESKPFTSGPISAIKSANQQRANQIVANAIGESDDIVDSVTLGRAFDRMSRAFDDFAEGIGSREIEPAAGRQFLDDLFEEFDDLTNISLKNEKLLSKLRGIVDSGEATGTQLRNLTSKLGTKANTQMTSASGDRQLGMALFKAKEFVDDLIESGLSPQEQAAYSQLRDQYRNYKLITSRTGIIDPSAGNVRLNALASALQSKDAKGFLRGNNQSDLYAAARFGQAFKPIVGDSGTATRSVGATDFVVGLPFNAASRAYFSGPSTAAISHAPQVLQNIRGVLGPAIDPRLLGLLGASAATSN